MVPDMFFFSCTGQCTATSNGISSLCNLEFISNGYQDADRMKMHTVYVVCCVLHIRVFVYLYVHTYAHMHRAFVPALWQGRAAHKMCVICSIAMCIHIHVLHVFVILSNLSRPNFYLVCSPSLFVRPQCRPPIRIAKAAPAPPDEPQW